MTPGEIVAVVNARHKETMRQSISTGWWAEYFARQKRLQPLPHYLKFLDGTKKKSIEQARQDYHDLKAELG